MRTARRPLEATGTLAYISHAVSLQTGGSAATRATVGSITVHTGNIRGQAYDYMPYAGATSAAATSSRRRMDPSLGPLGLNLASGLHGEDTTHMQYLGNVTRAELQPRAPRYIEVPQLKHGNQAAVSAIIAKHLEEQGTPAIDGVSCTVNKITIDNIDMYMATYGVRVAAKDVPAILTAHETDPVIVDIHSGFKVEEGRMRCITSEAGAAMSSHTTRAYVQIHAMPSLFSCDSNSKFTTSSSPSRLAEIRQVIHSAAAGTLLAEFGLPPDDPQMLPAYVARVKSSELYTLLRALDVTALTPDPSHRQGLYVIHSDNDQLTAMLNKYHKIQVTVQHMLKLTISAADPPPVPRYGISISSATGNMESMAALPKILWHLQNQHVNGKLPELLNLNSDAKTNKNWMARITTETPRPLHFSSAQGDLLCLKTEGDKQLLEITYKHPLTNQVTTFTTEGSNAAAAAMVFCAMDGSSLESDSDLRRHSAVLLRTGSKQDQINVLTALLCKAEWEGLHAGLPRRMISPEPRNERPKPPVLFSSIVGEEDHDSVSTNRVLTGLNYISGPAFFVLRSVCATAEDCLLQFVTDANALSSLYTTGMQYMLHAWLARDNTSCTMAPEVIRAGSHLPPTQPPRAAPRMGLGLSLRLVAAQAQLQDPSAAIPTKPPSTSAGTSQTLRPPAGSRPYTAGRGQPAIGGRGQPQLGAGNSRGPSPTGGRGKGDPAGSQGNRSSRGSSGSISDFDELAITAGIIPSLKAPAPSNAPANDPKHPQVHETSGQNPPGNEVVKGKVWGDSLARKLAASSHAPLVAPDSAERSAQRLCRGLEGPIGNHGLAGGSMPGEKTVEEQSTGSAPPVNGITNPVHHIQPGATGGNGEGYPPLPQHNADLPDAVGGMMWSNPIAHGEAAAMQGSQVAPYSAERLAYRPNRGLERLASSRNLGQRLLEATGADATNTGLQHSQSTEVQLVSPHDASSMHTHRNFTP